MNENTPSTEDEVSWMEIVKNAPVRSTDGDLLGTTEFVLGDEFSDVFHGIAFRPHEGHHPKILLSAQVTRILTDHVETSVAAENVVTLEDYKEEHWYHPDMAGVFRKHISWKQNN